MSKWFTHIEFGRFLFLNDYLLAPLFTVLIIFFIQWRIKTKHSRLKQKYLLKAVYFKILCTFIFAGVYQYHYKGGDTNTYFLNIQLIHNLLYTEPNVFFNIMFSPNPNYFELNKYLGNATYLFTDNSILAVTRIGAFLSFPLLNTYILIAMTFSMFCLYGCWKIFELFHKLYPHLEKQLAIACLFLPSVGFWGSGLLKDPICLGALGALIYHTYKVFFERTKILNRLVLIFICFWTIKVIKVYILLSFIPAFTFWIIYRYKETISSNFIRSATTPILFLFSIILAIITFSKIANVSDRYTLDNLERTAKDTQNWIYYSSKKQGGSGYTLGEVSYTPSGLIKVFPKAVNVALFRPYIWEARKPILIPAAIEGLVSLFLTIRLLYKAGFVRFLKLILTNPEVQFCLVFSIMFAFSVGFTSYNFGSLVRYKIPLMPFYYIALFILADKEKTPDIVINKKPVKPKPEIAKLAPAL